MPHAARGGNQCTLRLMWNVNIHTSRHFYVCRRSINHLSSVSFHRLQSSGGGRVGGVVEVEMEKKIIFFFASWLMARRVDPRSPVRQPFHSEFQTGHLAAGRRSDTRHSEKSPSVRVEPIPPNMAAARMNGLVFINLCEYVKCVSVTKGYLLTTGSEVVFLGGAGVTARSHLCTFPLLYNWGRNDCC